MPIYNYTCPNCNAGFKKLVKNQTIQVACGDCGAIAERALPTNVNAVVMETRDAYRGKKVVKGIEQTLKDRSVKHHDKYELAEKIDKFGMNEATERGWLKKIKKI